MSGLTDPAKDSGRSGGYAPEAGCRGLRSSGTGGPRLTDPALEVCV